MPESFQLPFDLPAAAQPAVAIIRELVDAGHVALLAGGCVRDLLLGFAPHDYNVATDAPPGRVQQLFRGTRQVGAQFGVVLVRRQTRWIEVATFRYDGPYLDGRHPIEVRFTDARGDAQRRDFTVNGMFIDPLRPVGIDYIGGRADLEARRIRAIGEPAARFEEDHLRLLRAVRFAAWLDFSIEPDTLAAIRTSAAKLSQVAAERVREELEKMLAHPRRRFAVQLMADCGLLAHLWPGAGWSPPQLAAADSLISRLPEHAKFETVVAALLAGRDSAEIRRISRELAFSNDQYEAAGWLIEHQADLDSPEAVTLSHLKRLMAHPAFGGLRQLAEAGFAELPDGPSRVAALAKRLAAISPEAVEPPPFINGDDLLARGVPPGPVYKKTLDALYTRQLDETIRSREAALVVLAELLREHGHV